LLIAHALDRAAVLQLQFARHQQGAYLHVGSGLIFPHLRDGFRAALAEVCGQRFEERLIENVTRTLGIPAKVSRRHLVRIAGRQLSRQCRSGERRGDRL
jgi:hypothetical protein